MPAKSKPAATPLIEQVRKRLGTERLQCLGQQPLALAAGGIDTILHQACTECAGYKQPVMAAANRTLQLCGSVPKPDDLKP